MLTEYERELVDYYYNRAMGKKTRRKKILEEKIVKHTKNIKKEKTSSREIMEEIQFEYGLDEKELDDLLIPEEEWDDLEEQ